MSTKRHTASPDNEWIVCKGKHKANPMAADVAYLASFDTEAGRKALHEELERTKSVAYRRSAYEPYFTRRGVNLNKMRKKAYPP